MPIPLEKTVWGLGKPFPCRTCGATLTIEKRTAAQTGTAMALEVVAKFVSLPLALLCGVFIQMAAWKTSQVELTGRPPAA